MKIKVGVLGATGIIGQTYLQRLREHPWFEVTFLAASPESAGKKYKDAVLHKWHLGSPIPSHIAEKTLYSIDAIDEAKKHCSLVFSAINSDIAAKYEELYAKSGLKVVSSASTYRLDSDIPLLIPEINPNHLEAISTQQKQRGFSEGFIVTKPNCSVHTFMPPLFPLHRKFQIKQLSITTLQAISGAGYPGVAALNISGNVIPHILGEEEKCEKEPLKIFGLLENGFIKSAPSLTLSAQCNRVDVIDGHMVSVAVKFEKKPTREEIIELWSTFKGENLPSSPKPLIVYFEDKNRPQPRLDKDLGNGMGISVGRLKECPLFDYRFVCLSHNAVRGGAGGGILIAELLKEKKLI